MRRLAAGTLVLATLFLGGCWSRREIDRMALVLTMGVDADPAGVRLTVQVPQFRGAGGSPGVFTVTASASNLDEAGRALPTRLGRFVGWSHLQTVVVGRDYARQGLDPLLDFLIRVPEAKETARLVVADGTAADLLAAPVRGEPQPGTGLREILVHGRREGFAPWTEVVDFTAQVLEPGIDPATPVLRLHPHGYPLVSGIAVFRGSRLMGMLDQDQSLGYMAVVMQRGSQHLDVPFTCPDSGAPALIRIDGRRARVDPELSAGRPVAYRVTVRLTGHPSVLPCRGALTDTEWVSGLERAAAAAVHASITAALDTARTWKADIFGLGQAAYRRGARPAELHVWTEVPVSVAVSLTLRVEGTLVEPVEKGVEK